MRIGIVGLGLIGGSLAKATKALTTDEVFGFDIDEDTMNMARMTCAIDGRLDDESLPSCDLVLLAVRPGACLAWTQDHASMISSGAILVDCCGVKRAVSGTLAGLAREHGFSYIGGHPMAGTENGGFRNSRENLFEGASMILVPDEATDMAMLEKLKGYFLDIGFERLTFSNPEEHDRIIAYTSQLAHVTASAYVKSPAAQQRTGFSAGSFNDMTRVAKLDEVMWTELMLDNADNLAHEVRLLISNLAPYADALEAGDADALRALLREGREKKATAGGR